MIVYLSGAMENAIDEGADWRGELTQWLKSELDHDVIDPVITSKELVEENNAQNYRDWKTSDPDRFIQFVRKAIKLDLNNVMDKADYVICLWTREVFTGGGTHGEVTMAYTINKPVYLVNQVPQEKFSGWIMSCATEIFPDFSTLKSFLLETYRFGME
ncbi:MAG: hypothetical protein ACE5D0_02675 [Fidelibacterota bacterium]